MSSPDPTEIQPGDVALEGVAPYSPAYTRYVMGILLLVMAFSSIDRTILSILVEPIRQEFGFSDTEMGALMGVAFTLVYTLTALPVARWADFGVRTSIVALGLFFWSCATVATAFAKGFLSFFVMRMGVALGESAGSSPSVSLLSDYLPPARRAAGLSVIPIGSVVGMGAGMIVGGWVNEAYGWRWAFIVAGVPGIALALLVRFTIANPPRGASEVGRTVDANSVLDSVRYLLGLRTYRMVLLANAFALFASMGRNLWEPTFLMRTYELGTAAAGTWYFVTSPLPSILGIYLGGHFADRLSLRDTRWYMWVPALGQAVSVPILLAFLLWPASDRVSMPEWLARSGIDEIPVAFILSWVGSVFSAFFTAPFITTIQGVAKLRMRALGSAMQTMVSSFVGLAAGPLLVGVVSDALNMRFGQDALRYSLLIPTAAPLFSSLVCLISAGSIRADLARAREPQA